MSEAEAARFPLRIAVIGIGRAGRARVRDIGLHPETEVAETVHRDGPPLAGLLESALVDAVAICTPNALHEDAVEAALRADKHVLVEFPLATSRGRAAALFALARERGRVLHAEHIELLAPSQRALRAAAMDLGRPLVAASPGVVFRGGLDGWIGDPAQGGSPALRAVARLHRLVDLFGEARVKHARLDAGVDRYRLEVALSFAEGGEVVLVEERAADLARGTSFRIACERGVLGDPPATSAQGVFRLDLDCFVDRVLRGGAPYVSEERVLHVLGLVDQIDAALV